MGWIWWIRGIKEICWKVDKEKGLFSEGREEKKVRRK